MNHQQAYRVQRLILIIALMLILFGDTGMNAVFSFSHQPQSIWFYPQLVIALMTAAGPNLLLMPWVPINCDARRYQYRS
ncbi:hypothetical protein [Lactiplantibacillus plantarum]|uniref:hypothetical protein n=1 Tax=Lactiplantibacillus plantarum TaxID=1590 RepID=UPI0032E3C63D